MEFGDIRVIPARGLFEKGDMKTPKLFSFDKYQQIYYPSSFLRFIEKSYKIDDVSYLNQIISNAIDKTDSISKEIRQILSLNGLYFPNELIFLDHFTILQQMHKYAKPESQPFTATELLSITNKQNFSFTSETVISDLENVSKEFQKDIIPVFYTPIGFIVLNRKEINLDDSLISIIISKTQAFFVTPTEISTKVPSDSFAEMRVGIPHFHLIKFVLIDGKYQPIIQDESFYNYIASSADIETRLDGLAFPFESIGTRSFPIIGLIGRYSQIKRHLQHFLLKVAVEDFNDTMPFVGIYISETSTQYIFLYLPDDLPPTHPAFEYVSAYAYSFMKRVCCKVFCLAEQQSITFQDNFIMNGLNSSKSNRIPAKFLGSGKSATILKTEMRLTVGNRGKDTLVFNGIDELMLWKDWISRLYSFRIFDKTVDKKDSIQIGTRQLTMLLRGNSHDSIASVVKLQSKLTELEENIVKAYAVKDPSLDSLTEQMMSNFSKSFTISSRLTQALTDIKKCKCKYCEMNVNQRPKLNAEGWNEMCSSCKLSHLKALNLQGGDHPTSFLEGQVEYAKKQENLAKSILQDFRSYYLEPSIKLFATWFFDFYGNLCLKNGNISDDLKTYLEKKFNKKFYDDIEYFEAIPTVFYENPSQISSSEIQEKFSSFYQESIIPEISKPKDITDKSFNDLCDKEYERVVNRGSPKDFAVEVNSVLSYPDGTFELEIEWVNNRQNETMTNDHFISEVVDASSFDSKLVSRPVYSTLITTLHSQPRTLNIVNAFKYNSSVLIVSIMGSSLWVNVVGSGYSGSYLGEPLIKEKIDDEKVFVDFATESKILIITFSSNAKKFVKSFYIDNNKAKLIAERPLHALLPISANFEPQIYGIAISPNGRTGVVCSDYQFNEHEYAIIKFDPTVLSAVEREDKLEQPFIPLFVSNENEVYYRCDKDLSSKPAGNVFSLPPEVSVEDRAVGITIWRGKPKVVVCTKNGEPIITGIQISDNTVTFNPSNVLDLCANSIDKFGLGETDRMTESKVYNKSVISVDTVFDLKSTTVSNYFDYGKSVAEKVFDDIGGEIITFAHQRPSGNDSIVDLNTDPPKGSHIRSFFPLLSRITGAPRFLVCRPNPPPTSTSAYPRSSFSSSLISHMRNSPSLSLVRELATRKVNSKTLNIVDCFCDSSSFASSISSHQFMTAPRGSVSFATTLIPTQYNRLNKVEKHIAFSTLHWCPHSDTVEAVAISLLHALLAGGCSILYTDREIETVLSVLESCRESFSIFSDLIKSDINQTSSLCIIYRSRDIESEKRCIDELIINNPGDSISSVISSSTLIPFQNGVIYNSRLVCDNIQFQETPIEESISKIILASSSYGSLIDNKQIFLSK